LAQEGVDIALLARTAEALDAAASELASQTRRKVIGVCGDTTSDDSVRQAVAEAVSALGGSIDILVNAAAEPAGFAGPPKLAEITGGGFHGELDSKVMGYIRCTRKVVAGMQAQGWGRIVNISGLAARQTGNTVGSIRNVAVAALTKSMADEFGPSGINVSVVHPGLSRTERTGSRSPPERQPRWCPPRSSRTRSRPPIRSATSSTLPRWPMSWPSCAHPGRGPSTATRSPSSAAADCAAFTIDSCAQCSRRSTQSSRRRSSASRRWVGPPWPSTR
jgi:NAD(P)-dependent dehydrogenase (short-subunit alcohol dehydrogenase family)